MSKAVENLKTRRVRRDFDEISKAWWWFDETFSTKFADNTVAWQWELLRRSRAYREFYANATAIGKPAKDDLLGFGGYRTELRELASSNNPLGDVDPRRKWCGLFQHRCDPNFWWTALTERQRDSLGFYAPLYPRADVAARFGIEPTADAVFVERLDDGKEKFYPPPPNKEDLKPGPIYVSSDRSSTIDAIHPSAHILPPDRNKQAYIVITFDVRAGEYAAKQFRLSHPSLGDAINKLNCKLQLARCKRCDPQIVPTREQFFAQAWIPADALAEPEEILARFASLIGSRLRKKWLPECRKAWCEPETIGRGENKMTVRWPEFQEFPPDLKTKPARPKLDRDFLAGLCAFDYRRIETRSSKSNLLILFLKSHPKFASVANANPLADCLKRVTRLVERIDHIYS